MDASGNKIPREITLKMMQELSAKLRKERKEPDLNDSTDDEKYSIDLSDDISSLSDTISEDSD
jgi:hypothetical protein